MKELDCEIGFSICTTQKNTDKQNPNYVFLQVPKKSKPGSTRRGRWDFGNYYPIEFRICRFLLGNGEFETVATSLPRSFTREDIKALYHMRWGIETRFRDLKYKLGLVNLHGKSDAFAEQEIYANLTAFNFASRVCHAAIVRQPKEGIYAYKVNFKMAVALCREFIRTLLSEVGDGTVSGVPSACRMAGIVSGTSGVSPAAGWADSWANEGRGRWRYLSAALLSKAGGVAVAEASSVCRTSGMIPGASSVSTSAGWADSWGGEDRGRWRRFSPCSGTRRLKPC